jgi:hypothetical protein
LLAGLDDPQVEASARVLALLRSGRFEDADAADAAFAALLDAYDEDDEDDDATLFDDRLQPRSILVAALQAMQPARAAGWLQRFVRDADATSEVLGEVVFHALEDVELPREIVEAGAPLIARLTQAAQISGPIERSEHAAIAVLVAARLWPDDVRMEALIRAHTAPPISLLALAALDRVSPETSDDLIALVEDGDHAQALLALAALARCDLGPSRARTVAAALADHVRDDDPLCEAAHATLVELVERGALAW